MSLTLNTRNQILTAKLLKQGYRYHKLHKMFAKFYWRHYDLVSKFNMGLKSLLKQGLSEPELYGNLVCKFKKIVGQTDFSDHFRKIPYFAVYYARSRITRTWFLVSNWLEKVLFSYIIRSNFRASVPGCINTCKSEFSAENSDENKPTLREGMTYFGPSWLGREWVDQGIS